jgi:hypothetical protein
MDSHSFEAEPLPDKETPTWRVKVVRNGSSIEVGVLLISNETFPPRKRKGKVMWKLPDSVDSSPKFGEHEKTRLWEMHKSQKKERRKKPKENENGNDNITDNIVESTSPSSSDNDDYDSSLKPKSNLRQQSTSTSIYPSGSASNATKADSGTPLRRSPPPPPPPGFHTMAGLSLQDPLPQSTTVPPEPHPPLQPTPPAAASQVQQVQHPLPLRYFSAIPDQPLSSLGALVAATFSQLIPAGLIADWLAHYSPTALSSLLIGTAQVSCPTFIEKLQQWTSLSGSQWECQGWTAHPASSASLLLVLCGLTIQKGERLAFTLTLLLRPNENERGYLIENDILCLTRPDTLG